VSRRSQAGARRRRWPRVVVTVVVAIVLVAAGLTTWRALGIGRPGTDTEELRTTATVTRSTERQTVTVTGTFAPRNVGYLSFPVPGVVTSVRVDVGDRVSKGDVLAKIDARNLRSAVTVAEAEVDAAARELERTLDDELDAATVAAARAGLESAQQQLRLARHDLTDATMRSTIDGVVAAVNLTEGAQSGQGSGASDQGAASGPQPGAPPGSDPGSGLGPDPGTAGSGSGGAGGDTASRAAAA
jgi:membrane fusion protein, macrolide-specific efflux system